MVGVIKKYRVNYVIVDPIFYDYYTLKDLYTHPETPPPGFQLVFRSDNIDGTKILIYNTTKLIYTDFRTEAVPINDFDNLTGLVTSYGNLSLDTLDWKEGDASIKLESLPSPSQPNQSVAKIFQDIALSDWSKAQSFRLWVKSDSYLRNKIYFQIFDADENWGLYSIIYIDVGHWQNITLPIHSFATHSSTPPNIARIQRIVLGIYETPEPFTVWFDQLSAVFITETSTSGN